MRISLSAACNQLPQPLVNFPAGLINMDQLIIPRQRRKDKVVVVMGATGTGKSRLSIDLATRFDAEIINSDKMQVYANLDVITNKITDDERRHVPHHLLSVAADPDEDFTADEFVLRASAAAAAITRRGRLPIIAGGSNSFVRALVNDDLHFRSRYECCFLWVDVATPVLYSFVSRRVDRMVAAGLVEEAAEFFSPSGEYSRGIRRAIGVPEMDEFFRSGCSSPERLAEAIERIKANTRNLARHQLGNIRRLEEELKWRIHRLNATEAFLDGDEAWERVVAGPSTMIVGRFLCGDHMDFVSAITAAPPVVLGPTSAATAVAAATR